MERANGKGNSMKSESQIKVALREYKLIIEHDGCDENLAGIVQALEWVLKSEPTITVTPDLQVKVE